MLGRGGQEEGREDRHDEAGQDQGPGRQRGGEEHAREPGERLFRNCEENISVFMTGQPGSRRSRLSSVRRPVGRKY